MATETVTFFSGGALPGIPGSHGPGVYELDNDARTLTFVGPIPDQQPDQQQDVQAPSSDPTPTTDQAQTSN